MTSVVVYPGSVSPARILGSLADGEPIRIVTMPTACPHQRVAEMPTTGGGVCIDCGKYFGAHDDEGLVDG